MKQNQSFVHSTNSRKRCLGSSYYGIRDGVKPYKKPRFVLTVVKIASYFLKAGLHATLLYRKPDDQTLYVNFDPEILQLFRETKSLQRMGLEVPPAALTVTLHETKLKRFSDRLRHMIRRYGQLGKAIPPVYGKMTQPMFDDLTALLEPVC